MDLFAIPPERVGKLIRLALGSNSPGECFAAVDAIRRTLANGGIDLHWLADTVEKAWPIPVEPKPKPQREPDPVKPPKREKPLQEWQIQALELLKHPEILIVSDKINEPDFLSNMSRSRYASAGQLKWPGDIERRLKRRSAA